MAGILQSADLLLHVMYGKIDSPHPVTHEPVRTGCFYRVLCCKGLVATFYSIPKAAKYGKKNQMSNVIYHDSITCDKKHKRKEIQY